MENKYPEYSASTTYSNGDRFSFKGQVFEVRKRTVKENKLIVNVIDFCPVDSEDYLNFYELVKIANQDQNKCGKCGREKYVSGLALTHLPNHYVSGSIKRYCGFCDKPPEMELDSEKTGVQTLLPYGFFGEFRPRADYQSSPVSDIIENL